MSSMMGIQNMGGPVTGVLTAFPTPTIERGAPAHAAMQNMQHGAMPNTPAGAMPKMEHGAMPMPKDTMRAGHAMVDTMPMQPMDSAASRQGHMAMDMPMPSDSMRSMHERMMADPVIRQRVMADTALRRMMNAMMADSMAMPGGHGARGEMAAPNVKPAKTATAGTKPATGARRATTSRGAKTGTIAKKPAATTKQATAAKTPAKKPATTTTPPMDHSKMAMPPKKP